MNTLSVPGEVTLSQAVSDILRKRYEAWLLKQRPWCERCYDLTRAEYVERFNGADVCLCPNHAGRLKAVRLSDRKQIPQ